MDYEQNHEIWSILNASIQCRLQGDSCEDDYESSKTITVFTRHQEYDAMP